MVCNSFWIKKNRASTNENKISYILCRIWICNKEFNFSLDISVSMNLEFFWENWSIFEHSCTGNQCVQEYSKRAKNSPIFSKNAKFTLTLMSKKKLNFFLHIQILHFQNMWNFLSFSWFRMNYEQCVYSVVPWDSAKPSLLTS